MLNEHKSYQRFHNRSRLEKTVNSLLGLLDGITIDHKINAQEVSLVQSWLQQHEDIKANPLFLELFSYVEEALEDYIITEDELADIRYFATNTLGTGGYFDKATADIQQLHGVLCGIVADCKITVDELNGLSAWITDREHLKGYWPYDEIDSIVTAVLADGIIDDEEHHVLMQVFSEFIDIQGDNTITNPPVAKDRTIVGLCAVCPEIIFNGSLFCFTGASQRFKRKEFEGIVSSLGGRAHPRVTENLNYLVIGAAGNPTWSYSCYGRKVEQAVELRKKGVSLAIVHENDFNDALLDNGF